MNYEEREERVREQFGLDQEEYDNLAARFRAERGIDAPGKDRPLERHTSISWNRRCAIWMRWLSERGEI